jgi:hypothetical protein|tara:strand:+ start:206 stop:373 length:168 start_codon:yes stop_codon:yes gene_type:complete
MSNETKLGRPLTKEHSIIQTLVLLKSLDNDMLEKGLRKMNERELKQLREAIQELN